jgi:hypothetical protein
MYFDVATDASSVYKGPFDVLISSVNASILNVSLDYVDSVNINCFNPLPLITIRK